jgi:hypothetical protein
LVHAKILRFSVTYKIFNENCLIKYKEGTTKTEKKANRNISTACQRRNMLFRKL